MPAQPTLLPGGDERRGRATSYSTAARAEANAIRLPEHSRQRSTGQAIGAPQRAQSGPDEPRQSGRAAGAEGGAREGADDAAAREEQIEQHMQPLAAHG